VKCPHCDQEFDLDLSGEPIRVQNRVQQFIAAYCDAFKAREGFSPPIRGKDSAAAKRIVATLGLEKAVRYVSAYFAINDSYFIAKQYDLVTFEANLNKVAVAAETGKQVTQSEAKRIERRQTNVNAFSKMLEDENGER
jgi:hypothetical protein